MHYINFKHGEVGVVVAVRADVVYRRGQKT
jgi:hypothetical protein